jgi:hypothetical protein
MLSGINSMNSMDRMSKDFSYDLCVIGSENPKRSVCGEVPSSVYPRSTTFVVMHQMMKDDVKGKRLENLIIRSFML